MRYAFADCLLDTDAHTLTRAGRPQAVEPQVFDLILALALAPGKLVSRDAIVDAVWHGRIVSDSAISARIAQARKAVGDDGKAQRIIQTVHGRGLRLVADVVVEGQDRPIDAAAQPAPRVRYATTPDGSRLAWATAGDGPAVFRASHGFTHLSTEWDSISEGPLLHEIVGKGYSLIRFDPRGSGLTEATDINLTPERTAADMAVVADAAGIERFALYSESGGALDAIAFAAQYPERVSRLVLIGGYVDGRLRRGNAPEHEPLRALFAAGWNTPRSPFIAASMAAYFPEGPYEVVREMAAFSQTTTTQDAILARRDRINHASVAHHLGSITAPTLIIHGRGDSVHPLTEARKLAAGIPNSELAVYDSDNHMPLPGHPIWSRFLKDFFDFIAAA